MSKDLQDIKTRKHVFDETIKTLERKDFKGLASLGIPNIDDAEEVHLEFTELSMADMRDADYIAKVTMNKEEFILHMEFETNYKSNKEMSKRMLRYYTYINWYEELPIYQVLIILKKPSISNIINGIQATVLNDEILNYKYKVIKAYDMDKNEILKDKKVVLYPLRVFMKNDKESDLEHIEECLKVVEELEDKDYYYLTVELSKRLYKEEVLEKYVKEDIYMASALYKEPYDRGKEEERVRLAKLIIKQLTKKFGLLSKDMRENIEKLDSYNLELIGEDIFDLNSLEEVEKYISQ
ncbi:DUF4351 domain-containing protein [Clostridium peptidivorans]|uniref:DUF4351 domain-containing protein n=1 Tax=Clostridium peptidivorans TaxID=100174 RepID=UPI000BE279A6|nr:DUF4351 domain-containing protein [Clostridium peptidivorans]